MILGNCLREVPSEQVGVRWGLKRNWEQFWVASDGPGTAGGV